jgi:hypothetical protein
MQLRHELNGHIPSPSVRSVAPLRRAGRILPVMLAWKNAVAGSLSPAARRWE